MTREERIARDERLAAILGFTYLERALRTGSYYEESCDVCDFITLEDINMAIEALQERPKGRWVGEVIHTEIGEEHAMQECSRCGKVRVVDNFCPNCGSDNRGEEE